MRSDPALYLRLLLLLFLLAPLLPAAAQQQFNPQLPVVDVQLNGRNTPVEMEDLRNPLMLIQTTRGDLVVELFPADAPRTVANFVALAEGEKPFIDPRSGREVQRPFYDGLAFHRVVEDFLIQGGSPDGSPAGMPGFSFDDEINAISLGLNRMPVLNEQGYPNPVLGIRSREDFQQRVLLPLYRDMGIDSQQSLTARIDEVDERLRSMTVMDNYQLLGYRYSQRFQSRAPVRGMLAMANSGPDSNGSQFFLTLTDTPWLTGRYTVFGKVRGGMEVLESIAGVPVDAADRPREPVTILFIRRIAI